MSCQPYEILHNIVDSIPLENSKRSVHCEPSLRIPENISTKEGCSFRQGMHLTTCSCPHHFYYTLISLNDLHNHPDSLWRCLHSIMGLVPCEAPVKTFSVEYSFTSLPLAGSELECISLMNIRCSSIPLFVFSDCDLKALLWSPASERMSSLLISLVPRKQMKTW